MKKTNKLLLTLGTAAAITAPIAAVVACGSSNAHVDTPAEAAAKAKAKAQEKQISDLRAQIAALYARKDTPSTDKADVSGIVKSINALKDKLSKLGVNTQPTLVDFGVEPTVDLTDTDVLNVRAQISKISEYKSNVWVAVEDAASPAEMRAYYPKFADADKKLKALNALYQKLVSGPAVPAAIDNGPKSEVFQVSDAAQKAFVDYIKPLFDGGAPITSYEDFKNDKNNVIAKIGQVIGDAPAVDPGGIPMLDTEGNPIININGFSANEGKVMDEKNQIQDEGFGAQSFDEKTGMVPHVDIKYDVSKGIDEDSIKQFFADDKIIQSGELSKTIAAARQYSGAQTMNNHYNKSMLSSGPFIDSLDSSLKLFPYIYKDKDEPKYIHFALFAYKNGEAHYKNLRPFNTFKAEYDNSINTSIKRGVDLLSKAVGRDLTKEGNYYTTDADFAKIMANIYTPPKRDEMEYINKNISDADRISLFWQKFREGGNTGGFNTMASGRIYGIDPAKLYSGKDGAYGLVPGVTLKKESSRLPIDDINQINSEATPGFEKQTLADAQAAASHYKAAEQFNFKGNPLAQRTPGRKLPSLAQSTLDWSTSMFYDLGGQIPFTRGADGKITGFANADFNNQGQTQNLADLINAMWAMSDQSMGSEPQGRMGLTPWSGKTGRINPFLNGLEISYVTVRDKDNKDDLDIIFYATRNGKALDPYKMVIPAGAMNWDQIDEAVKGNPVYEKPADATISKDDFEFTIMKVMAKWDKVGSSVTSFILKPLADLLKQGVDIDVSVEQIDKYYDLLKDDNSIDLWRLKELVNNPNLDFMKVFMSEKWDSQSRKTLYTKYGENLINVMAKIAKKQITDNPDGVDQSVIDSLSNEFAGL